MALKLARHRFIPLHVPYVHPVRWAGHTESGVDVLLLLLETEEGLTGIGETPVRLRWHANTLKTLTTLLDEIFLPHLVGTDLEDEKAVRAGLAIVREHPLAKSLIDVACWDLRARASGVPLWRRLGATDPKVPVSWTVTRAAPEDMARQAEKARDAWGIGAFKVKTGQGIEADRKALIEIRRAVGDGPALYADSNSADKAADVPEISAMLADHGVVLLEDPCRLVPNDGFRSLRKQSRLPILVDNGCRSVAEAGLFLDAGAEALSVKVMKTGITESRTIAEMAQDRQARVAVGISAATSLGALTALALSASLPAQAVCAPCEETFFAVMENILVAPLEMSDGTVSLPDVSGYETVIDWDKVSSLRIA